MTVMTQFMVDEQGKRTAAVIAIDVYKQLLEDLHDLHDLRVVAQRRESSSISMEEMMQRFAISISGMAIKYVLFSKPAVHKDLSDLPKGTMVRVLKQIGALPKAPFPQQSKKLVGTDSLYRLRVGDYHIIYELGVTGVTILCVTHRSEAYKP